MAVAIDILHLFPELVTIGPVKLQDYCDAWIKRPIAKEYAIAQIIVDDQLLMHINLATEGAAFVGDRVFIPIDELLGYVVDCHFADSDRRRDLHTAIRETRKRWGELGRDYAVTIGRAGRLYLTCKNPACGAELETQHDAVEHQEIICPPTDVTCPACGSTHIYEGSDLHLGPNI